MAEEECQECKGGDCEIHPQFETPVGAESSDDKKVRLTTSKYVQLLIDARETNPDCWPPGLEKAAAMIERARTIEDNCIEKWGDFDPEKLSKKLQAEYFEIQLALDALQDEAGSDEVALEDAISSAHQVVAGATATAPTPSTSVGRGASGGASSGPALPTPVAPPVEGGFFAAPPLSPHDFLVATLAASTSALEHAAAEEESEAVFVAQGWMEMAPLQRGENYA